jgi:excisionase family DNA binding protein
MDGPAPATVTVEHAGQRLGISRTLAYRLVADHQAPFDEIPVVRFGRRLLVSRDALERWIATRLQQAS